VKLVLKAQIQFFQQSHLLEAEVETQMVLCVLLIQLNQEDQVGVVTKTQVEMETLHP
jgi:hypothetical protein